MRIDGKKEREDNFCLPFLHFPLSRLLFAAKVETLVRNDGKVIMDWMNVFWEEVSFQKVAFTKGEKDEFLACNKGKGSCVQESEMIWSGKKGLKVEPEAGKKLSKTGWETDIRKICVGWWWLWWR